MRDYITENVRRIRAIEAKVKAIRMDFRTICRGEDRLNPMPFSPMNPARLALVLWPTRHSATTLDSVKPNFVVLYDQA